MSEDNTFTQGPVAVEDTPDLPQGASTPAPADASASDGSPMLSEDQKAEGLTLGVPPVVSKVPDEVKGEADDVAAVAGYNRHDYVEVDRPETHVLETDEYGNTIIPETGYQVVEVNGERKE